MATKRTRWIQVRSLRNQRSRSAGFRQPGLTGSALILFALLSACFAASACSVPVFRFALERWPTSPYEVLIVHRSRLSAEQEALLAQLGGDNLTNPAPANLLLHRVDLGASPPPELLEIIKGQSIPSLPAMILRYPRDAAAEGIVWSGPLNEETVGRLLDSPARRRIVQRLLKGDSGVWVLLESGDRSRDDAAANLIQTQLERLQKTLQISQLEPEDVANRVVSISEAELKVAFSFLRLSREDLAEDFLVRMLTGSEEDLRETQEPMAFPVFGRGRVLYALVGAGINAENIEEACSFLVGPCSCVVKAENPGVDLLMSADWDSAITSVSAAPTEAPELTGPGGFTASSNPVSVETSTDVPPAGTPPAPTPGMISSSSPIGLGLLVVLALGAAGFLGGVFLLLRKKG